MGVVEPEAGFLLGLREITKQSGALLIMDEVITGFRVRFGAAQQLARVQADLTTLGKIIGGGLPAAAYGGGAEIMNRVAPLGPVYQAGTLAGNPLAMRAGIATLKQLTRPGLYEGVHEQSRRLAEGLREALAESGIAGQVNATGSLATLFFTALPVRNYSDAKRSDTKRYARFFREMLDRGVFLAPSQFEAAFVSAAHTSRNITQTIAAARDSLKAMAAEPAT
jgi:glutamate-1-semialdehyde 2,1-aminomutase